MTRRRWLTWTLVVVLLLSGCQGRRTRGEECLAIFDRVVELELAGRGFQDVALAARFRVALRQELAAELERCRERPWDANHAACVRRAASIAELRRCP